MLHNLKKGKKKKKIPSEWVIFPVLRSVVCSPLMPVLYSQWTETNMAREYYSSLMFTRLFIKKKAYICCA